MTDATRLDKHKPNLTNRLAAGNKAGAVNAGCARRPPTPVPTTTPIDLQPARRAPQESEVRWTSRQRHISHAACMTGPVGTGVRMVGRFIIRYFAGGVKPQVTDLRLDWRSNEGFVWPRIDDATYCFIRARRPPSESKSGGHAVRQPEGQPAKRKEVTIGDTHGASTTSQVCARFSASDR